MGEQASTTRDRIAGAGLSRRDLFVLGGGVLLAGALGLSGCAPASPTRRADPVQAMLGTTSFTVAHRGGSADWPEMSKFAYDQSVRHGVDALEMSVVRTADGVWFGAHDGVLDRVAGVSGFVVKERTWEEVQSLRIRPPDAQPDQESQPLLRVEDFIDAYSGSHALWIDPKAVHRRHYEELMALMTARVATPSEVFVAKCDAAITEWGELARRNGMQSWGFYYGRQFDEDPDLFEATQSAWTMLGLDWNAEARYWEQFVADGRPVVAHVIDTVAERDQAVDRGAVGLMVAGVAEVLG